MCVCAHAPTQMCVQFCLKKEREKKKRGGGEELLLLQAEDLWMIQWPQNHLIGGLPSISSIHIYACVWVHACMRMHVCVHVCAYVCVCVCMCLVTIWYIFHWRRFDRLLVLLGEMAPCISILWQVGRPVFDPAVLWKSWQTSTQQTGLLPWRPCFGAVLF